jgi:hypothetical protein
MNIHRAPGDIGNLRTFDFPIVQTEIKGALLVSMVSDVEHDEEMIDAFVAAGQRLIDQGAIGLVTSCGFWAISQTKYEAKSCPHDDAADLNQDFSAAIRACSYIVVTSSTSDTDHYPT